MGMGFGMARVGGGATQALSSSGIWVPRSLRFFARGGRVIRHILEKVLPLVFPHANRP
jgi:hypothetical protein